eukprot:UN05553
MYFFVVLISYEIAIFLSVFLFYYLILADVHKMSILYCVLRHSFPLWKHIAIVIIIILYFFVRYIIFIFIIISIPL